MPAGLPSTVSREELLLDGRDDAFRTQVTSLLHFGAALQQAQERIAAAMGVSALQYAILMTVARSAAGGTTVTEVAAVLRVSVPFIVAQNRGLIAAGLLSKQSDPNDRRQVRLVLTASCRAALKRIAPVQRRVNDSLFGALHADECRALHAIMRKLTEAQGGEGM